MLRILSHKTDPHDDDSSDEEIRWGEETTAWDELLRMYREGAAQKKTQQTAGTMSTNVTLDNLSQTTHGTQPGCQSRERKEDNDSFLEFFPEWKDDEPTANTSSPEPTKFVDEIDITHTPPKQLLKSRIKGRNNNAYAPTTIVENALDQIDDDDDDEDFFQQIKKKTKHVNLPQQQTRRPFKTNHGSVEAIETESPSQTPKKNRNFEQVQQNLKRQKIAEAALVAFAADALERNPNSGRLSFQKKTMMLQIPKESLHQRKLVDSVGSEAIEDPGNAPPRNRDESWLRAPAITSSGFRLGYGGGSVSTPVFNLIMKRFKTVHAPISRSGQLSAFLLQTTKMLTIRNNQLAKNSGTSENMIVKVIKPPGPEGRVLEVQIIKSMEGRGSGSSNQGYSVLPQNCKKTYMFVTSHQIMTCTFEIGTVVCVHFPFHIRPMGVGRSVIMGADLLTFPNEQLPSSSIHLNNPLSLLVNTTHQEINATSEWKVIDNDEWELPPGTWEKVNAMLTPIGG